MLLSLSRNQILECPQFRLEALGFGTQAWLLVVNDGLRGGMTFPTSVEAIWYCRQRFGDLVVDNAKLVTIVRK